MITAMQINKCCCGSVPCACNLCSGSKCLSALNWNATLNGVTCIVNYIGGGPVSGIVNMIASEGIFPGYGLEVCPDIEVSTPQAYIFEASAEDIGGLTYYAWFVLYRSDDLVLVRTVARVTDNVTIGTYTGSDVSMGPYPMACDNPSLLTSVSTCLDPPGPGPSDMVVEFFTI